MRIYEIAICDDEEKYNLTLYKQITKILTKNDIGYTISIFNDGFSLIDSIRKNAYYDLIFLDILMDKINGIETAAQIRKIDSKTGIVFITSSPDYVFYGYDVRAINYLIKPVSEKKLTEILLECFSERVLPRYIDIKDKNGNHKVLINNIIYAESNDKKLIIHTQKNKYIVYKKLDELEVSLPKISFVRCHKSYLVNLIYISNIKGNSLQLRTEKQIPISRSNYQFVKTCYINYIGEL